MLSWRLLRSAANEGCSPLDGPGSLTGASLLGENVASHLGGNVLVGRGNGAGCMRSTRSKCCSSKRSSARTASRMAPNSLSHRTTARFHACSNAGGQAGASGPSEENVFAGASVSSCSPNRAPNACAHSSTVWSGGGESSVCAGGWHNRHAHAHAHCSTCLSASPPLLPSASPP